MPVRIFVRTAVKMELGMGKTAGGEVFWGWGEMSSVSSVKFKLPRSNRQLDI